MKTPITIHWFRRDLRIDDNAALYNALQSGHPVLPIFIFDTDILHKLNNKRDARLLFITQELKKLKSELEAWGSSLQTFYGSPLEIWKQILKAYEVKEVHVNRDYEPYARERDKQVYHYLKTEGIEFKGSKDHVIFEKKEVIKDDGNPYTIFTPYSKKWKTALQEIHYTFYPTRENAQSFFKCSPLKMHTLEEMGFEDFQFNYFPKKDLDIALIKTYDKTRDIPSISGTTHLGIHLRFGTVSIRTLVRTAILKNETWLNELIWRDFYQMILYHFPHSEKRAFKPSYDRIPWRNNEQEFQLWCIGKTGYPIVDAGMRELNETGFMHNRVRMIVASFLTKHLLIDWRWGERYFAEKLLDFDLASNVGGWQWAASSGCDAAPYFRVFNPELQTEKFDKDHRYIRQWVKEYGTPSYPEPIAEHKYARERVLRVYKEALNNLG